MLSDYINRCPHIGCPSNKPWPNPDPFGQCVLNQPLGLYIPPGGHTHLTCPVHPEGHILYGSPITW